MFTVQPVLVSIVVSIPACHAGDQGSIPRLGGMLFIVYFDRTSEFICNAHSRIHYDPFLVYMYLNNNVNPGLYKMSDKDLLYAGVRAYVRACARVRTHACGREYGRGKKWKLSSTLLTYVTFNNVHVGLFFANGDYLAIQDYSYIFRRNHILCTEVNCVRSSASPS